jgi:hypothetical protein
MVVVTRYICGCMWVYPHCNMGDGGQKMGEITEPSRAEWKLIRTDENGTSEFEIISMNLQGSWDSMYNMYGTIEVRLIEKKEEGK